MPIEHEVTNHFVVTCPDSFFRSAVVAARVAARVADTFGIAVPDEAALATVFRRILATR